MTREERPWDRLRSDYLRQVEEALSSIKHPRVGDVLGDVASHLDTRFAELAPEQRTLENMQAIISEMGPAREYAELLGPHGPGPSVTARRRSFTWIAATGVALASVAFLVIHFLSGPDEKPDATYILTFAAISPFNPKTAQELLDAFNEKHFAGARTHHYRTEVKDGALIGHICVDTRAGRDAVVDMLKGSDRLEMSDSIPATAKQLERLYRMGQPSLEGAPAR